MLTKDEIGRRCPYYARLVPKDLRENLRFRRKLLLRARTDKAFRQTLWSICQRDILFWFNAFAWTYDTRCNPPEIPFITYEYQDDAILELQDSIKAPRDMYMLKSRDMGASWLCVAVMAYEWGFDLRHMYAMVSRNADYVDKTDNPKSLFWKLDFLNQHLPGWMLKIDWRVDRTDMHVRNPRNKAVIDGESTTGDVARGDRRRIILLDEFAAFELQDGFKALSSSQAASPCRWFNSTPQGTGNAHHSLYENTNIKIVRLHWAKHPKKRRGLYIGQGERLLLIDTDYWKGRNADARIGHELQGVHFSDYDFEAKAFVADTCDFDYEFILDGKLRSPWYDDECGRMPLKSLIAQELDLDFLGSGSNFFDPGELQRVVTEQAKEPHYVGDLSYEEQTAKPRGFREREKGLLRLWLELDVGGKPPARRYAIGADVSRGTGASNSCLVVADRLTNEKVAEFMFAGPDFGPHKFAEMAVAIGRWFADSMGREAYLNWEANGPGDSFGQRVRELGYRHIFLRRDIASVEPTITDAKMGWWATADSKKLLLTEYGRALAAGEYVNRSERAIRECGQYKFVEGGKIVHVKAYTPDDPSGARDEHGDLVIADGVCWLALRDIANIDNDEIQEAPEGSAMYRRLKRKKDQRGQGRLPARWAAAPAGRWSYGRRVA